MDIHAAIKQVAEACGVTTSDVETFAQLTATQIKNGLEGAEAIQAAHSTYTELANRAFRSIQEYDPHHPYSVRPGFAHTLHRMLTASCGPEMA